MTTFYWSRIPGKFVDKQTGVEHHDYTCKFTGTVREWYETLVDIVRGAVNTCAHAILYVHPDVFTMLQSAKSFRPGLDAAASGCIDSTIIYACNDQAHNVIDGYTPDANGRFIIVVLDLCDIALQKDT